MATFSSSLSVLLALVTAQVHAEVMPDRPDPTCCIIEKIKLPPPSPMTSKLIKIPYPMPKVALNGVRDGILKLSRDAKNPEIAITIDDGPSQHTSEVLKVLHDYGVKATFFLVGDNVKDYPDKVIEILREGHSVGNHTWDHPQNPNMTGRSIESARKQIQDTKELLEKIVADENRLHPEKPPLKLQPFFRFPEGAFNSELQKLLAEFSFDNGKKGYANFHWIMSVHDSRTRDHNIVLTVAIRNMLDVYRGGILLLHETRPWTREMLPYFLQTLKDRNYTPVYFQADEATATKK